MNLRSVTRPEGADAELKIKKGTGNEVLTQKNFPLLRILRNDLFLGFSRAEFLRKLED